MAMSANSADSSRVGSALFPALAPLAVELLAPLPDFEVPLFPDLVEESQPIVPLFPLFDVPLPLLLPLAWSDGAGEGAQLGTLDGAELTTESHNS